MKSILLVKTSSLGDVVHNLPVASDIKRAFPDSAIDWIVEENFAAIPGAHEAVRTVIPVALRRWRRSLWRRDVRDEIARVRRAARHERYDAVIDTQGLLKSALIATMARGMRYGLDWRSSREPLALFYDRTFSIPWTLHAVERNRALAARALGYSIASEPRYGLNALKARFSWLPEGRYAVLIHATSASRKLWPENAWRELASYLAGNGLVCCLPWGSAIEEQRSRRIASASGVSVVPPSLPLQQLMSLLAGAALTVGVDTGLTHLSAALGTATVGVYCATDPASTGVYGAMRGVNVGGMNIVPPARDVIRLVERLAA
jgi:heptosyltransferase-1